MSTIKVNKPAALFLKVSDGTFTEVDIQKPLSKQLAGKYTATRIEYEEGVRVLKNVVVTKRDTPKFVGPSGETDQELIYDIFYEEEEWES